MRSFALPNADATERLGAALAAILRAGDVVALEGDLGAGKTTLTRGLIRALCGAGTEVPSPTYTLVQTYEAPQLLLWHFDLYRLEDPGEVFELGWTETAGGAAIIEWPDRAGRHLPTHRLTLRLETVGDHRRAILEPAGKDWQTRLDSTLNNRGKALDAFIKASGWGDATQHPLGQDASTRRYIRMTRGDETAMAMDAPFVEPPHCPPEATEDERAALGWNAMTRLAASRVDAFVLIAGHLRGLGLSAPKTLAHDSANGFALIEDFGTSLEFARLIERGEQDEVALYTAAAEALAHLHHEPAPAHIHAHGEDWPILEFDDVALGANADLFADWLHQHDDRARMTGADRAQWEQVRDGLIEQAMAFPRCFTLRDYHAENLLWLKDRTGVARVGLLDFQDAVRGWDAWDMAMLTQDARRAVSFEASEAAITRYLDLTGKDRTTFDERLAVIGTLNALRITGVFARLVTRDGKPRYLDFMPRQQMLLARNLQHPAAKDMAAFVRDVAPFIFEVEA